MLAQSNPHLTEFVLIEYPGVVRNVDKALETLGGQRAISTAHFASAPLELQFRPENPFHSSLSAERRTQGVVFSGQLNLVLRCRRRKKKPVETSADGTKAGTSSRAAMATAGDGDEQQMEIKCLGMVSTIYSFKAICDFQYLPLSNKPLDVGRPGKVHQDLMAHLVPADFTSAVGWLKEQQQHRGVGASTSLATEAERFLPPYQFSRYNNPSKFLLHDDTDQKSGNRLVSVEHGKSLRTERKALTVTVGARDPFPVAPSEEAMRDVDLRCKNADHHRMLIELFAERPMWSRVAIGFRTHIHDNFLKVILAKYAFYISSGPWGRLWCRFGYDPHVDPEARKFQSVMVSFKSNPLIPERPRLRANTTGAISTYGQFFDYMYRPRVLPDLRQMWYSICDIQLPVAQKICRQDYIETLKQCDPSTGWLSLHRLAAIRRAIREDVALTSQRLGALEGGGDEEEEEEEMEDLEEPDDVFYMGEEEEGDNSFELEEEEFNVGPAGGQQRQRQNVIDIDDY